MVALAPTESAPRYVASGSSRLISGSPRSCRVSTKAAMTIFERLPIRKASFGPSTSPLASRRPMRTVSVPAVDRRTTCTAPRRLPTAAVTSCSIDDASVALGIGDALGAPACPSNAAPERSARPDIDDTLDEPAPVGWTAPSYPARGRPTERHSSAHPPFDGAMPRAHALSPQTLRGSGSVALCTGAPRRSEHAERVNPDLPTVELTLWRADAVVLFDWLSRVDLDTITIEHPAERERGSHRMRSTPPAPTSRGTWAGSGRRTADAARADVGEHATDEAEHSVAPSIRRIPGRSRGGVNSSAIGPFAAVRTSVGILTAPLPI